MDSSSETRPLRIFVVEDHADSLKCLSMYLKECGHMVRQACNAQEAFTELKRESTDILLTDIGLPDGSGWDLMRQLTDARCAPRYAVAMSGYGASTDFQKSETAGFKRHLLKPLDAEDLDQVIAAASRELGRSGKRRSRK